MVKKTILGEIPVDVVVSAKKRNRNWKKNGEEVEGVVGRELVGREKTSKEFSFGIKGILLFCQELFHWLPLVDDVGGG